MELFYTYINETSDYVNWLWRQITIDSGSLYNNYFWFLGLISLFFFFLEVVIPWRKKQPVFRKDFWLDAFYMYFNFFIFYIIIFYWLQNSGTRIASNTINFLGIQNPLASGIQELNLFWKSIIALIIQDFTHWNIHRLLHKVPFLWRFHRVHHSVKQMGFAAHLRFHWMESIIYKAITFLPLYIFFGFDEIDFFYLHLFTIIWGHFNHTNINIPLGPFKYIFNSPQMHIWHHAKALPNEHPKGVNFGLTLSIWDYLFGTNYQPENGRDIKLGFEGDENYPKGFFRQIVNGFRKD